jgi:hypothetical protein
LATLNPPYKKKQQAAGEDASGDREKGKAGSLNSRFSLAGFSDAYMLGKSARIVFKPLLRLPPRCARRYSPFKKGEKSNAFQDTLWVGLQFRTPREERTLSYPTLHILLARTPAAIVIPALQILLRSGGQ